ncbi:MAG: hypothetical protein GX038_03250, partial [Erysipelothrix sp.]|nr:hypothetical protein [Erysipelothrix sp.]
NGNSNLKIGNNKIEIVVTSSGKDKTETYVINAYKQEYGNNFLAYLAVNRDKLKPAFHQGTMVYEVDVSYEFDTIEITGETVEASAQVSNLGEHQLEYGINQIKIPVRAHNGVVRTYHVFVNRSRSHDNYLNTLQIQVGGTNQTFTPKFDPKVNEYTLDEQLSPDVDFVNIITTSNAINIVGNGQQAITVGKNKLEVKVTSDSGRENIYYINLDRVASTNANLINIIPTSGKLSPNFLYTEDTYTIYVDTATTTLAFETITENKNATVTGNDRQIVPVGDSQRIITVTSENGQEKEYTINLKKNDTNNALMKSLSMHDLVAKKEIPISPEFDTEVFTYNVTVPNSKTVVRANEFQFTTWDSNATVETSGTMSLLTGEYPNVYEFRVTAVDGFTSETYRINITRESSNIATIDEIEFSNGVLDKRFNPHVFEYDLEFEQNAEIFNRTSITKLIRTEGKSTITYSHDEDIVLKEGTVVPFIITVTSEDGKVVNNYTFNVTYKRSRDNKLSSIEIANAIFEPEFNPEILEYDINVHEDITEVVVRAFARDPKAKVLSVLGDTELINYTTTIEIKVEAENGSIATYKLNIKRGLSHDLTIEDLRLTDAQGAKFNPEFDNFLSSYEATVNREVDHVGIVVIKGHDSQIVSLYDRFNNPLDMKNFELNMGRNLFKLKIASPFGDEKFIDILIVRDGNSNNYLEALEVLDPQIDINFDQDKHEYFIEIPYNFDNLRLNAVAQESSSTVEILRNDGFTVGNNDVIIRVTAENGDVRNYVIHVFKKGLYNNVLQTITVSVDGKVISEDPSFFTPHFHKGTLDYTVKVNSNVKVLTVEGVPEENSTTVSGSAANVVSTTPRGVQIELNPGNNLVKLTSTDAVDGQVLIYRVNIVREMSGDADLNGLEIFNKDTFVPFNEGEFSSARNFYSLEVDSSVTELRVIASATNPQSRVTITGNTSLLNGENLIKVTVTSEDRTRVKVYSIIVTKTLPTNTDIDSLNITHDEATDIHEFDMESELFEYSVPHDVESVMVGGSTSDPLADINGLGRHALDYGVNELKITVRAQSGLVKTYVINVTRAYNNELESLKINQGLLEPEFEQGVYYYTVWVPLVVDRMNFEAIPEAATSTVTGDGWHNLEIGSDNFIKITVSSPDGSNQETIIKVIRSASPNNQIAILEIDQGLISPEFDSNQYLYDTYIKDFNTEIDLTVILEDEAATYEVVQPQNAVITGERVNIKGVVDDLTEVIIRVTAENGDTKDTVLNVHRQPAALFSNLLSSLTVSPVKSMSPTFRPTTNQYIALVDEDINFITITATKQSVDATIVKGTGTFKVEPGRNTYEIVVRSKDGIDNVYRVIINQAVSADASLKSLSFDEGLLTPVFSRGRKEYRMNVSANTNFLTANVEPYANGTTWKPTGGGFTEDLVMGENTIVIDTLATNKIGTDKYTVAVNKTTQTSVYLSELRSNTGNFTEAFNKYSEGPYTLEIDANVNSLMLSAKAEEPASVLSIEGVGIIDLMGVNNKTVEILVTGNAGNTMKYYVNIVKKLKDDVKLSYLAVSPGTLTPQFNENISKYEVNVDSSVDRIEIFANTTGPATIEGTGIKDLKPGVNTFDVTLTTDLGSIGVYTIVVNREVERSAKIFDLSFKEALIEAPLFEKDTFEYQLYVPYEVTELTIRDIILEDEENSTYELVQTSFAVGNNVVVINVKNTLTNDEETYTFNVTRYAFSSNFLTNLYTDQGLLSPSFDKLHNNYDINIPYDVTQIELIGQKEDGTSSEVGLGVHRDLEVGINELKVVVTSATGVPRTYIVRVNRLQDSRNELLTLDVVGGVMSPKFGDSEFNEYTVNVNADVNEVEFIGTIPDTATVEGLGKLTITKAEMKHEIIVTAQDGSTTKYKFTIKKQLSTDSGVINIKPSVSVLDPAFEQDVHTYTVTVEDETNRLGFEVTTSNKFARVTGHEEKQLSYGDNLFVIEVKSEDGSTSVEYVINVIRLKDIHGLQIDPDNYVLNLNEEKELDLIITPIDAPNSGITWESDNEAAVTVDENGKITGVGIGTANIIATYTKNPAIKATVSVEVMSLSIESDILDIERDILTESDIPGYVIGSDLVTTDEFTDLFINEKSTLKVFDMDGNEINEPSDLIAQNMY